MSRILKQNVNEKDEEKSFITYEILISPFAENLFNQTLKNNQDLNDLNSAFGSDKTNGSENFLFNENSDNIEMPTDSEWNNLEIKILRTYRTLLLNKKMQRTIRKEKIYHILNVLFFGLKRISATLAVIFMILLTTHIFLTINKSIGSFTDYQKSKNKITSKIFMNSGIYIFAEAKIKNVKDYLNAKKS